MQGEAQRENLTARDEPGGGSGETSRWVQRKRAQLATTCQPRPASRARGGGEDEGLAGARDPIPGHSLSGNNKPTLPFYTPLSGLSFLLCLMREGQLGHRAPRTDCWTLRGPGTRIPTAKPLGGRLELSPGCGV